MTTLDLDTSHLADVTPCKCDNCGAVTPLSDLDPIQDPGERLSPNSPVPAGECPNCDALAYVIEDPEPEVIVIVSGGVVRSASKDGQPFTITVHDFDVEDLTETQLAECETDDDGNRYEILTA